MIIFPISLRLEILNIVISQTIPSNYLWYKMFLFRGVCMSHSNKDLKSFTQWTPINYYVRILLFFNVIVPTLYNNILKSISTENETEIEVFIEVVLKVINS